MKHPHKEANELPDAERAVWTGPTTVTFATQPIVHPGMRVYVGIKLQVVKSVDGNSITTRDPHWYESVLGALRTVRLRLWWIVVVKGYWRLRSLFD